ncbi:MAG: type III pantothenate kinase [Alphaproteobacteria bacterium]|nr:type III pantothenate kinase [Alphaproteobacteria bacterium]PHY00135.1 MAG: pantothenate kinase [Rhodospirillaceae bacterium]
MLLAIDCGNTNIVFAVFDGETLRGQWRAATKTDKTADEFGIWLTQVMTHDNVMPAEIDAVILASVVPARNFDLTKLCEKYFKCAARFIGEPGLDLGTEIKIDNPREVGADRVVNVIAAHALFQGPSIVIDFGTATTFDVVDGNGAYCGGVIAPGINLSMEALHMATALLPRIPVQHPGNATVVGTSTVAAMTSGVFWGYVGLIEGLVARIKAERGVPMRVLATGGLAPLFAKATTVIDQIEEVLTLRGLLAVHRRNSKP